MRNDTASGRIARRRLRGAVTACLSLAIVLVVGTAARAQNLIRLAGTSFEEPAVGAVEYTPGPGARELGFRRQIDANNNGTFGDEDAGGMYGVVDSSDNLTLEFTECAACN